MRVPCPAGCSGGWHYHFDGEFWDETICITCNGDGYIEVE